MISKYRCFIAIDSCPSDSYATSVGNISFVGRKCWGSDWNRRERMCFWERNMLGLCLKHKRIEPSEMSVSQMVVKRKEHLLLLSILLNSWEVAICLFFCLWIKLTVVI